MRELIALAIVFLALQIPWTNGIFFAFSLLVGVSALLFFCLALVDRLFIGGKMGYRIKIDESPMAGNYPPAPQSEDDQTPRNKDINY